MVTLYRGVFDGIRFCDDYFLIGVQSPQQILSYFTGAFLTGQHHAGGYFRPLVRLFLAGESWLFRESLPALHAIHFIVFIGVVFIYWLLARVIMGCEVAATIAAALFICFPTQPHTVYWLSSIGDLLAGLFVLLALLGYLAWRCRPRAGVMILCLLSAFLGFLSKEVAAALPLLAVCLELWRRQSPLPVADRARPQWRRWLLCAALFALLGVYFVWRRWAVGGATGFRSILAAASLGRLLDTFDAFVCALFNPFVIAESAPWRGSGVALLAAAGALAWLARSSVMALALAWAAIPLAIYALGGTPSVTLTQWYFFLPSAFLCLYLAAALRVIAASRWRRSRRAAVAAALGAALLCGYAIANQQRMALWKEAEGVSARFLETLAAALPAQPPVGDRYLVALSPRSESLLLASPVAAYRRAIPMFLGAALIDAVKEHYHAPERVPVAFFPPVTDDIGRLQALSWIVIADFERVRRVRPVGLQLRDLPTSAAASLRLDLASCHLTCIVNMRNEDAVRVAPFARAGAGYAERAIPPLVVPGGPTAKESAIYLGYFDRCQSARIEIAGSGRAPQIEWARLQIVELTP